MTSTFIKNGGLRRHEEYTHKFNASAGRHGWLRLTPAYSLKIVEDLILQREQTARIFDPFCGTGTTALSAAYHGREAVTCDINPFLVWLARAKTTHYSAKNIAKARAAGENALDAVRRRSVQPIATPPIHNIDRWWSPDALLFLRSLGSAIPAVTGKASAARTLLTVAFCRSLIEISNAAFNHQSMSFKEAGGLIVNQEKDLAAVFAKNLGFVLLGASNNPRGNATVMCGDSRSPAQITRKRADLVVTSPPYANRMSYIRELRPYMYWLGFLRNGRDAGELDWATIGGTWGIATSRLSGWRRAPGNFNSALLNGALKSIGETDKKNSAVLANYVAKYFDDVWGHIQNMPFMLSPGAEVHYIVGNSTFYGALVPTELFYAEMLDSLGFKSVNCTAIRKRNSKKELVEFDVTGKWQP